MKYDCFGDPLPHGAILRLGTTRLRHGWGVKSVAFSSTGDYLVSGGTDNCIRAWDMKNGKEIANFRAHYDLSYFGNSVEAVAASPTGDLIAAASGADDCKIYLYSMTQRKILEAFSIAGMTSVQQLAFSPDGEWLACAGLSEYIFSWNIAKRQSPRKFRAVGNSNKNIAFTPNGSTFIASSNGVLLFWDWTTDKRRKLINYKWGIPSFDVSPDGSLIACLCSYPCYKLILVSVRTGHTIREFVLDSEDSNKTAVRFFPDGKSLAVAGNHITIMDSDSGQVKQRIGVEGLGCGRCLSIAPDGKTIANELILWDVATERPRLQFAAHHYAVTAVSFSSDGTRLITASNDEISFAWWDRSSGRLIRQMKPDSGNATRLHLGFSSDGTRLAWGLDEEIFLFNDSTKLLYARAQAEHYVRECLVFSRDGKMLSANTEGPEIHVWDAATGKRICTFPGHADKVTSLCFFPDNRYLASGSRDEIIRIWDISTQQERCRLVGTNNQIFTLCVSPDSRLVASGSYDGQIRLWEMASNTTVAKLFTGRGGPACLSFSPDSKSLAWSLDQEFDTRIHIYNFLRGQEVSTLDGHSGSVRCLSFSEDGKYLASGSRDTTVLLWDISGAK